MKKKIIVLLLMLTFILSSCGILPRRPSNRTNESSGNTAPTSSTDNEATSNANEPEALLLSVGDDGMLKDWSICISEIETTKSIPYSKHFAFTADEGNQYFIIYLTITNNGKQASSFLPQFQLYNDISVKLLYLNEYEYSPSNLVGHDDDIHDTVLNPLASRSGLIAFQLPDSVISSDDELILEFSAGKHELLFKVR